MLIKDIIWSARHDYLDDAGDVQSSNEWFGGAGAEMAPDLLWQDEELLRHLNAALNEWCRFVGSIRDHLTPAICKTPILCYQQSYSMDARIIEIHNGYLASRWYPPVTVKTITWLDDNVTGWKTRNGDLLYLLPDYDAGYFQTIYFPSTYLGYWTGVMQFTGGPQTIVQSGTPGFSPLLKQGDQFVVTGTTLNGTAANPKTFTVGSVTATTITTIETIATELAASAVIQKVLDTMWLTVSRLPLNQLTTTDIQASAITSPEIRLEYHPYLVHGILKEAYSKQDSQCLDVEKAKKHSDKFDAYKLQAKFDKEASLRGDREETAMPHPGAL